MASKRTRPNAAVRDAFRAAGERCTPQRLAVYKFFSQHRRSYSIADAVDALAAEAIGQATVYRTVPLLQDLGLLSRIHAPSGEHRWVATRPGHFHALACRSCGRVEEFAGCDLDELEARLARRTGYHIEGHHMEMYGLCRACASR
jgi:Fe2+ or Zn2+ uptake regulation protein